MPSPSEMFQFLRGQILQTPPIPTTSFAGRTVIITGGNIGLGFEAAKHMVRLNVSRLILGCRSVAKGEEAVRTILASTKTLRPPEIEVWQIDMANYDSVLSFGERASRDLSRLDAVVLNAGVSLEEFELAEGIETTLTINVVSTFFLANLVLPKLRETAERQNRNTNLTVVGSSIHIFAKNDQLRKAKVGEVLNGLSDPKRADMAGRYLLSKLLVTLYLRELATQLQRSAKKGSSRVVVNDVNPGWCKTALFRNEENGLGNRIALYLIARTGEVGGRTLVHAASAGKETHGRYLSECQVKSESSFVRSEAGLETQRKLWNELRDLFESIRPGVTGKL